jgi:glycosyltransferase involved in cell wall biosynthesis
MGQRRLRIGMVTGGLKFAGDSLTKHSLGGSETAFLCAARELAARGHSVRVWVNTDRPGTYDGVEYVPLQMFDQSVATMTFDVLIASRWPEQLAGANRAHLRILWLHDTLQDKQRLMGASWQTDEVWLLSDFHIKNYCGKPGDEPGEDNPQVPELRPHIWKTNNGVDLPLVQANIRPKVKGKVIYTSRPERGLHYLMGMVPELVKRVPEFKLYYANYSLEGMQLPQHVIDCVNACNDMAKRFPDRIIPLGHLTKERLYQEISSSELMLYPTDFPEISCITAMEAQACGTPIVSTDDFALSETVNNHKSGLLIKGTPSDPAYLEQFIAKTARLLQNEYTLKRYSEEGPKTVVERGYTWKQVVETWEKRFYELVEKRSRENEVGVIRRLIHEGDLHAAQVLAETGKVTALAEEIQNRVAKVENPEPVEIDAITDQFGALQPAFRAVTALLQGALVTPQSVLEVCSGFAPFGFWIAKNFEGVQVTIVHDQPEVLSQLRDSLKLKNVFIQGPTDALPCKGFDLVFLNKVMDRAPAPAMFVAQYAKTLADASGGAIAFITGFGPNAHTLRDTVSDRFWNFDYADFSKLFPPEAGALSAAFVPANRPGFRQSESGHWVGVLQVKDRTKVGLGFSYLEAIEHRKVWTRPYQRLGVAMIVKNEETNILKCLKSIKPYVDQIVVADTGSKDSTVSKVSEVLDTWPVDGETTEVNEHGDQIMLIDFDNFSQARNASMEPLNTEWVFWLDADEELLGGDQIRRYLDGTIYEGFVVRQQHLMIDLHGTFDTPIRILRRRPHYKFVGLIHEHCEDTSRGPYGHGIRPSIVLNDVDLAHYGYPSEKVRRQKCSNRNMSLLIRDLKEHPNRPINKLLFMRDCLNIVKWYISSGGHVQRNTLQHALLNTAVALFFQYFEDPKNKLYKMTEPMYQEALKILAAFGLPFEDRKTPPFEIALSLAAAVGKPVETGHLKPQTRMFVDDSQFQRYMQTKLAELSVGVGAEKDKYKEFLESRGKTPFLTDTEAAVELLNYGANAF